MNRTVFMERIEEAREILEKLLVLLQSAPLERDQFVSHLYQSRTEYPRTCETAGYKTFSQALGRARRGGLVLGHSVDGHIKIV